MDICFEQPFNYKFGAILIMQTTRRFMWGRLKIIIKRLIVLIIGFKAFLYLASIIRISIYKFYKHDFFYFISSIPKGGIVLDIGANIGYTTYHLSKIRGCSVHSFEPISDNYEILQRIILRYRLHNVKVHQIALGCEKGEIEMIIPNKDSVRQHALCYIPQTETPHTEEEIRHKVHMERLDDIEDFAMKIVPIRAIKIDAENYEYYVLRGAENILRRHRPVIYCEIGQKDNIRKIVDYVKQFDYHLFKFSKKGFLVQYSEKNDSFLSPGDFFLIPTQ